MPISEAATARSVIQGGDGNHNPAPNEDRTFNIFQANQTISFGAFANTTFTDPDFNVNAMATSGLAVNFTTSGDCTNVGNTVHITGAGSCTVTAHQLGDANYNPAPDVARTSTPVPRPLRAWPSPTRRAAVICSIVSGLVHIVGTSPGTCTVTAPGR